MYKVLFQHYTQVDRVDNKPINHILLMDHVLRFSYQTFQVARLIFSGNSILCNSLLF